MAGFGRERAVTVDPHQRLNGALEQMQRAEAWAPLVMADVRVREAISAQDIQGKKPVSPVQSSDCAHHTLEAGAKVFARVCATEGGRPVASR